MTGLKIYEQLEQGSQEWLNARCGLVTASTVGSLITSGPPDPREVDCPTCGAQSFNPCLSATRKEPTPIKTIHEQRTNKANALPHVLTPANNDTSRGLTATLVAERVSQHVEETWPTRDMQRGHDHEPVARAKYAEVNDVEVTEVGFMTLERDGWTLGYSPDGLVGDLGLIEIKSPRQKTHVQTILADEVPTHYMPQIQAGLFVSGRRWCDFVSFSHGLPLWTKRVYPEAKWQTAIAEAVTRFEHEAERQTTTYLTRIDGLPTTERIPDLLELTF